MVKAMTKASRPTRLVWRDLPIVTEQADGLIAAVAGNGVIGKIALHSFYESGERCPFLVYFLYHNSIALAHECYVAASPRATPSTAIPRRGLIIAEKNAVNMLKGNILSEAFLG